MIECHGMAGRAAGATSLQAIAAGLNRARIGEGASVHMGRPRELDSSAARGYRPARCGPGADGHRAHVRGLPHHDRQADVGAGLTRGPPIPERTL